MLLFRASFPHALKKMTVVFVRHQAKLTAQE